MKHSICFAILGVATIGIAGCAASSDSNDEDALNTSEALGVTGLAFYFDGTLYRTVGTPTDLPQDAPDDSFNVIYNVKQCQQYNVSTAAPGSADFKGGRWRVHKIAFSDCMAALAFDANHSGDLDYASEVEAAIAGGIATDEASSNRSSVRLFPR